MELIMPDWIGVPANVQTMSTTRKGGCSLGPYGDGTGGGGLNLGVHVGDAPDTVRRNRALLRARLPADPAWLTQVHGTLVLDAAAVRDAPEADASFATRPGTVCVVQTADCLPVLFCDTGGKAVGAAHAGWRGLAHGVLENTIARMREAGAGDIIAWLGPAIGPDCFEVGQDVFDAFVLRHPRTREAFRPHGEGKYLADIYLLARVVLQAAGVDAVFGGNFCTIKEEGRFYSYRRDKVTGRMASLIWLK